jgi:hypothetical protein
MLTKHAPNRPLPTQGPLVVLGGSDGRGWDVETREQEGQPAMLVGRFNSLGDAKLFAATGDLLKGCEAALAVMTSPPLTNTVPAFTPANVARIEASNAAVNALRAAIAKATAASA